MKQSIKTEANQMLSIVWGVDQPVNQPWGCTPLTVEPWWEAAGCHWHCGIDVGDPYCLGKPLRAARAGTVTQLWAGILGIQVANGETDFYVHGTYLVDLGAEVSRGQRIGSFGNIAPSGGSTTGPHLHFERQRPGGHLNVPASSLDPVPVLTATFGTAAGDLMAVIKPPRRQVSVSTENSINLFGRSSDNTLSHQRFDAKANGGAGAWSDWQGLKGVLTSEQISAVQRGDVIDVFVIGTAGELYQISSPDDGRSWGPWVDRGHALAAVQVLAIASSPAAAAAAVDLSPAIQAANDAKAAAQASATGIAGIEADVAEIKDHTRHLV